MNAFRFLAVPALAASLGLLPPAGEALENGPPEAPCAPGTIEAPTVGAPGQLQAAVPGRKVRCRSDLPSGTFVLRGVRVFDGSRVIDGARVVVRDGRIEAVGADVELPEGIPAVDGRGRTLLPGLTDAHVHTFDPGALAQALAFGVTLQLDMFTSPELLIRWRREQAETGAPTRADVLGPGYLATASGGHGTQFGLSVPTLGSVEEVPEWIQARVGEGADFIKIVLEDGSVHGTRFGSLEDAVLDALVASAHEHGLKAVVHVSTVADAERAVAAGADGLVHVWADRSPPPDLVERMLREGVFVIPTLTVLESVSGQSGGASLLEEDGFPELLDAMARQSLTTSFPPGPGTSWDAVNESVTALIDAGVPLLVGSDAPNPGTTFGASVHREMELLVEVGLSPIEALRAATSNPALAFGLEGRGIIAPGVRADLVLVEGDPTRDIRDSRRIVGVWKGGHAVDPAPVRDRVRASLEAAEAPAEEVAFPGSELLVSDFEDGTLASSFGMGWTETTDRMIGGSSSVTLEVVDGGVPGSQRSLRVQGEVAGGAPFGWAGAMFLPGSTPMAPVDLSRASGLAFQARGDGPGFQIFVFTGDTGPMPWTRSLELDDGWQEVFVPWADLPGGDASGITGIVIAAGPAPGVFDFQVDQVFLR